MPRVLAACAALFGLNAVLIRELFTIEYTRHLGSIEAAYIAISRWGIAHPFSFDWFPLWYGGIPFQNTYPPLLHAIVAAAAGLTGMSPALAHHFVSATFYSLIPVALFLCAGALSRRWTPSFAAALLFSLVSPAALVMPSASGARMSALVEFGEGPHITAILLLPLALLALHWAIEKGGPARTYLAAFALAAVVLSNWLGAFALALLVVSYLLARGGTSGWLHAALIGTIAFALAATWIPPSTLRAISHNAQNIVGKYPLGTTQLLYGSALILAAAALRWTLLRYRVNLAVHTAALFTLFTGALVAAQVHLGISIMPQADRYHLEFEMGACVLAAFGAAFAAAALPKPLRTALAIAALALLVLQARDYRSRARELIQPIDIAATVEYQAAAFFAERFPDQRVYAAGASSFWLNAFSSNLQVGGGFDQGIHNPLIPKLDFGIPFTQGDGARTAMWLRVLGAQAVLVSGPQSSDPYKDWRDPAKFAGLLPELWRNGDDAIYAVPQRSASLAHVILPEHAASARTEMVEEDAPIRALAAALEDPSLPLATLTWITPAEARITADLAAGHLLFVQISHHPGWHATNAGQPRAIRADSLGLMLIEPQCTGPCEIILRFDGGTEMTVARALTWTALLAAPVWFLIVHRRRATAPAP